MLLKIRNLVPLLLVFFFCHLTSFAQESTKKPGLIKSSKGDVQGLAMPEGLVLKQDSDAIADAIRRLSRL